ncbi:MAG: DoxX family protein [Acidimicrobiia bacterium]
MSALFLIGRILFVLIFVGSGMGHFTNPGMVQYAESKGVPAAKLMVWLTGLAMILGAVSILLWRYVEVGTWLIVAFLLTAAFKVHDFWAVQDPMQKQVEMAQFMKNLSMAGAAIVFYALHQDPGLLG